MIGHQLNGHTILAAAPDGNDSWAILARSNDPSEHYQYVTSMVHVSQLPAPKHWGQGHYIPKLEDAAKDYLNHLVPHANVEAYVNEKEFARQLAVFCLAIERLSERVIA